MNLKKTYLSFFVLILLTFSSAYAEAEKKDDERSSFRKWVDRDTFTGDWYGCRTKLEDKGFTISSNFTTDVGGNPVGGVEKNATYCGFYDISLAFDFEKMASLKGTALTITNCVASGDNLSSYIGNFFGVQEIYASGNYYLSQIDLSQALFKDKLVIEAGRLFAGDVFAQTPLWQYYVSGGINGNFGALAVNIFFPEFNITAWAARLTVQPNKNWQIVAGIYNADKKVEEPHKHGFYFKLGGEGYLALGQITYKYHQGKEENGLPGSVVLGGYYESSKFQSLADLTKYKRGNYGFYTILDQMIYKSDWPEYKGPKHLRASASYAEGVKHPYHRQQVVPKDRPMGLTAWLGAYGAPEDDINTQIYQLTAGFLYQGLFPNRNHDVLAFAVIMGKFSDKLPGQTVETVLELNYRIQAGPWFYFTPDVQYIFKPNGQSNISNALVLGFEASVNF